MKRRLFVRTDLTVPGVGSVINIADLEEIDATRCAMVRMIELDPQETIMGAMNEDRTVGQANQPNSVVPHPDTYDQFPDIKATHLSEAEFEALWTEALTKFPDLT